jgi:hypothetical protein
MQLLALTLCLLASVAVVSCGSSVSRSQTTVSAVVDGPPNIVSPSEIAHAGMSSPQGVVLRWFQAVQYRDYSTVLELTASRARRAAGTTALRNAVSTVGSALGKPSISGVIAHGPAAVSVHVVVLAFSPRVARPTSEAPITLALVKAGSGWQVNDLSYLLESASAISAAKRGAP